MNACRKYEKQIELIPVSYVNQMIKAAGLRANRTEPISHGAMPSDAVNKR